MKDYIGTIMKILIKLKSALLLLFYFVILFALTYRVYSHLFKFYITVKFDEVAPIHKSMEVYYKGFKVGKTIEIKPSADYKYTLVKVIFSSDVSILPDNITAKVRKEKEDNDKTRIFMELVYPDTPSLTLLKKGSIINGKMEPDMNSFLSEQIESGMFGAISDNMNKTLESAEKTSDELREVFTTINDLFVAVSPNLIDASASFAATAKNLDASSLELNQLSVKLNRSVKSEHVDRIVANITNTTTNVHEVTMKIDKISGDVNKATVNLDKTVKGIDETIVEVQTTVTNVKNITGGVCKLLGHRFPGMRLMFGKPFDNEDTCGCSCGGK